MNKPLQRIALAAAALILATGVVGSVLAHAFIVDQRDVGDIRVYLAYFADGAYAGVPLELTVALSKMPADEPLAFDEVAVRVSQKGKAPAFSETLRPTEEKVALFDYKFPCAGEYEVRLTFPQKDARPIDVTFPFDIMTNPFLAEETLMDRMLGMFRDQAAPTRC